MRFLKEEIERVLEADKQEPLIFGDLLYKLRKSCGLCLIRSAELMGLYYTRLRYFENNLFHRLPKKEEVDKIALFYELEPEFLWGKCQDFVTKLGHLKQTVPDFKIASNHREIHKSLR
jgi:hypothetical protein